MLLLKMNLTGCECNICWRVSHLGLASSAACGWANLKNGKLVANTKSL
jgi:hypothetical protein